MSLIVSVDIGTSTLCAMAYCARTRKVHHVVTAPNDSDVSGLPEGRHEQDPAKIVERCEALTADLRSHGSVAAEDIAGIAITGQMHGVVLVDKSLEPLTNLITWRDLRTLDSGSPGSLACAVERVGSDACRRTGAPLSAGYGGATLFWMRENNMIPQGAVALTIADVLAARLTGVIASEPTDAASWGIYDVAHGRWDAQCVSALGLPEGLLPPIKASARPIGTLHVDIATQLGLPAETPVCSPIGDNQASFIGAAGPATDVAVMNLGTGGQISISRHEYTFVPGLETRPLPHGGFILVGASLCGGWSYAYLCRFFRGVARDIAGVDVSEAEAYTRMNVLAAQTHEGADGLTADTRFSGARHDPDVRGSLAGIDRDNLTPGGLARAILEGMVTELLNLGKLAGIADTTQIVAAGNAVRKNPLLPDIIAQLSGRPCHVSDATEESALGAAVGADLRRRLGSGLDF